MANSERRKRDLSVCIQTNIHKIYKIVCIIILLFIKKVILYVYEWLRNYNKEEN